MRNDWTWAWSFAIGLAATLGVLALLAGAVRAEPDPRWRAWQLLKGTIVNSGCVQVTSDGKNLESKASSCGAAAYIAGYTTPVMSTTCVGGELTSATAPDWTLSAAGASGWTHSSGVFTYTGTETRVFLVSWHINALFTAGITNAQLYGRVLKATGGSYSQVDGSDAYTTHAPYYTSFGTSYYAESISNSFIVSVATNNTLKFDYGIGLYAGSDVACAIYASGGTIRDASVAITPAN